MEQRLHTSIRHHLSPPDLASQLRHPSNSCIPLGSNISTYHNLPMKAFEIALLCPPPLHPTPTEEVGKNSAHVAIEPGAKVAHPHFMHSCPESSGEGPCPAAIGPYLQPLIPVQIPHSTLLLVTLLIHRNDPNSHRCTAPLTKPGPPVPFQRH